jgi:iron complex outermembrane receptor protein
VIGTDRGSDLDNNGVVGGPGEIYGRAPGANFFGYIDPDGSGPLFSSDFAFKNQGHVETYGVNLRGRIDLSDSVTLSSVTDYKHFGKLLFIDVDSSPANQLANYGGVSAHSFSQELRLNGKTSNLNWVFGLYYLNIDDNPINGLKVPVGSVVPGGPFDIATTAHLKTQSYSAFGQLDWDFAPKLRLVVGARIISEHKNYNMIQQIIGTASSLEAQTGPVFANIGPVPAADPTFRDKFTKTLWAGKLQLEYRPNADTLIYAGVNRGSKAGSYNAPLAGGLAAPLSALKYGDETLWNYEAGFKLSTADNKLRLNGAVYYYDYKNYQSFLFTGVSGLVVNADARTIGGELSLQANPIPGLTWLPAFPCSTPR